MAIYQVTFATGHTHNVNDATNELDAMRKAHAATVEPMYCRIHEEIAERSSAPVGEMGLFFPKGSVPKSAKLMREIYVDGGYCIIAA